MKKRESENIQITVDPAYIPERSDPTKPIYMFSYRIKIKNTGAETIQLKSRYWHITDGNGNVEEIRGPDNKILWSRDLHGENGVQIIEVNVAEVYDE